MGIEGAVEDQGQKMGHGWRERERQSRDDSQAVMTVQCHVMGGFAGDGQGICFRGLGEKSGLEHSKGQDVSPWMVRER